jgi:hypothetical protein
VMATVMTKWCRAEPSCQRRQRSQQSVQSNDMQTNMNEKRLRVAPRNSSPQEHRGQVHTCMHTYTHTHTRAHTHTRLRRASVTFASTIRMGCHRDRGSHTSQNSANEIFPSPSLSLYRIVLSTIFQSKRIRNVNETGCIGPKEQESNRTH